MNALRRAIQLLLLPIAFAACERSKKPVETDSSRAAPVTSATPAESTTTTAPPASTWDAAAGPVLVVRADSPGRAYVVYPQYTDNSLPDTVHFDVAPLQNASAEFFGHAGALGEGSVRSVGPRSWRAGECIEWPTATVATPSDSASAGWSVALLQKDISGVPLDSIEGLSSLDSAKLAADVTRLVSALPGDTARAFRGIPFAVRNAYRFTVDSATPAIAADVVRKLNQEAMPLEEHTFIIAEKPRPSQGYDVVYSHRTSGTDESLVTLELLAAVRLPVPSPPRTALVLLLEGSDTNSYSLLERTPRGAWRMRWRSVGTGC